jgi:hypothetical protein
MMDDEMLDKDRQQQIKKKKWTKKKEKEKSLTVCVYALLLMSHYLMIHTYNPKDIP